MPKKELQIPKFDNLADLQAKFDTSIVMYGGKACVVKQSLHQLDPAGNHIKEQYMFVVCAYGGRNKTVKLEDPLLSWKDYNIGYANTKQTAAWWYRVPLKQFRQGLRREQMGYLHPSPYHMPNENFGMNKQFVSMLENDYPSLDQCEQILKDQVSETIAFHKNFALSWDDLHEDFILECKGKRVGVSINNCLTEYRLKPEFGYLAESLQEAIA
jgi:hypothetical protein